MVDSARGFTIDEIVENVQIRIGNNSTAFNTFLFNMANLCEMEICNMSDWSFLHTTGSITYTSDTASSTLPTNCLSIEDIVDVTNGAKLRPVDVREIDRNNPSADDTGEIQAYAKWGNTTVFWYPKPNVDGTLSVRYKQKPAYMISGSYPTVPFEYQYLIMQRLFCMGLQHETDDRYTSEYQVYKSMILDSIQSDMLRLEGDDRIKWPQEEAGDVMLTYDQVVRSWYGS